MARLLEKLEEIKVRANIEGTPLSLTRNGKSEKITRIYEHWQGEEVQRDYFRIKTSKGLACDIYHDTVANLWYLTRIHD